MMEDDEEKRGIAIQIALEAGVLEQCEFHEDCLFEGGEEIEAAYKLGNFKISNGEYGDVFESRREMTDLIKEVVQDNSAEECYSCAKNRDD
ncbi:hypothetical protein ACFONG_04715 [Uliginosibacterium paludis]|uniref:Uncharacterized protein n=1 Tax=Uliginosibacterium paludis TaxID=1615952 RepID=A0ABV2CN38_9RHOO